MHELSLMEEIVDVVEITAKREGFTRIKTLWVEIGQLAVIEKSALMFAFKSVSQVGLLAGSSMEVIDIEGMAWCESCLQTVHYPSLLSPCPLCSGYYLQVTQGDRLRIVEIEGVTE